MMRLLLIITLLSASIYAKNNVSLSKVLMQFQGQEYNMLLFPKQIVVAGRMKKTKKAIKKGYKRAILELKRQVKLRGIDFHLKIFSSKGSNVPQYRKEDMQSYKLLKEMLKQQIAIREQLFNAQPKTSKTNTAVEKKTSVDAIDVGDIDDDAFDISDDATDLKDKDGNTLNMSPADAFTSGYVELSEQYNQEVLQLSKVKHPFEINNKPEMKPVHSVFGMAFFPTKYGSIKEMKIYMVLCNINTEASQSVQIIAKEIPNFEWDRNYLYISAATGKILRQIISGVLGESFLETK